VQRYIDSNNLDLLAVLLKCKQVIALIAVDCEQLVDTNYSLLCILIKVHLCVLGREVIAALKDNKR
jgi:hypothetical protein